MARPGPFLCLPLCHFCHSPSALFKLQSAYARPADSLYRKFTVSSGTAASDSKLKPVPAQLAWLGHGFCPFEAVCRYALLLLQISISPAEVVLSFFFFTIRNFFFFSTSLYRISVSYCVSWWRKCIADDVSVLLVLLDTNPFFWSGSAIPFSKFISHVMSLSQILVISSRIFSLFEHSL